MENKKQFLNRLIGNIFRLDHYEKEYGSSIYGICIGAGLYGLALLGIEGRDALEYIALGIAGLSALTGHFSAKKLGKLESEVDEQMMELKERRFENQEIKW